MDLPSSVLELGFVGLAVIEEVGEYLWLEIGDCIGREFVGIGF